MIDVLVKLIEKGIELLREGERQRKLFFDDVVKPIQAVFETMCRDHLVTFKQTRCMLLDTKHPASDIATFVEGKVLLERGTIHLLIRLTDQVGDVRWRRTPTRGELDDRFAAYLACVTQCLASPSNHGAQASIVYYAALSDVTRRLSSKNPTTADRESALHDLEQIVERFHCFYSEVTTAFHQLQRYCSA
jgi:hypothetical protein